MKKTFADLDNPVFDGGDCKQRYWHIRYLLWNCMYKNWRFRVGDMGKGNYLQVVLDDFDDNGDRWMGRKWYISRHMIDSEIVMTAFKAVLTAEEHETREKFIYSGEAIFGPHLSLEALVANAKKVAAR